VPAVRRLGIQPPTPRSFGINKIRDEEGKIFELKGLTRKIRKTKEIGLRDPFPVQPLNRYGVAHGFLSRRLILEFLGTGSTMGRKALSGCGTSPHKPKEGLCGPPARLVTQWEYHIENFLGFVGSVQPALPPHDAETFMMEAILLD